MLGSMAVSRLTWCWSRNCKHIDDPQAWVRKLKMAFAFETPKLTLVTHFLQQGHTHLLILPKHLYPLGTKHSNIWTYRDHLNSNYHIAMQSFIQNNWITILACLVKSIQTWLQVANSAQNTDAQNSLCIVLYLIHTGTVIEMDEHSPNTATYADPFTNTSEQRNGKEKDLFPVFCGDPSCDTWQLQHTPGRTIRWQPCLVERNFWNNILDRNRDKGRR